VDEPGHGFIGDARTTPPEVQAEARRRGLIPDLAAERARMNEVNEAARNAPCEAVRDVVEIVRRARPGVACNAG
jgi:hypothetical protein